jgi:hypothetical protein
MTNLTREMWEEATVVSTDIINHIQKERPELNHRLLLLALAITYTTLSKGTGVPMHSALELVLTIYKNTEILKDE